MSETSSRDHLADMAVWSAPLVADHIFGLYERMGGGYARETLARQHCAMWVSLLAGDASAAQRARRALFLAAGSTSVTPADIEAIDYAIVDDLLGVILRRTAASRDAAHACGLTLVQAAHALGAMRAAA